jgi:hypothetical protein
MGALRRVEAERAGPSALGILVPPGRRTFLIVRPRSLTCDLLLLQAGEGLAFRDLAQSEAQALARELHRLLEARPVLDPVGGAKRVEVVATPDGKGSWLRARVGALVLLACPRRPGQAYEPLVFTDEAEVRAVAARLEAVLWPHPGVDQELYFNTRHFGR